jgi:hypothetical protein
MPCARDFTVAKNSEIMIDCFRIVSRGSAGLSISLVGPCHAVLLRCDSAILNSMKVKETCLCNVKMMGRSKSSVRITSTKSSHP